MATKRIQIRNKLAQLLSDKLDGTNYTSNIYNNVGTRQVYWDELHDFPTIAVVNGRERTEYHPSQFSWKFLTILIKVFVKEDDSGKMLEQLTEDIESIIDANNSLEYEPNETTEQISLIDVEDDGGILYPFGVSELSLVIQYQSNRLF